MALTAENTVWLAKPLGILQLPLLYYIQVTHCKPVHAQTSCSSRFRYIIFIYNYICTYSTTLHSLGYGVISTDAMQCLKGRPRSCQDHKKGHKTMAVDEVRTSFCAQVSSVTPTFKIPRKIKRNIYTSQVGRSTIPTDSH